MIQKRYYKSPANVINKRNDQEVYFFQDRAPAAGREFVFDNVQIQSGILRLTWYQEAAPYAAERVDIVVKTFDASGREMLLYDLPNVRMQWKLSATNMNSLILPIQYIYDTLIVSIVPQDSHAITVYLVLDEVKGETLINKTGVIYIDPDTTITAGNTTNFNVEIPVFTKFFSCGFGVLDTNAVSKDYQVRMLPRYNSTTGFDLESELATTSNNPWFDLIPVNPLFYRLNFKVDNNDGVLNIDFDALYLQFFF